MQNIIKIFSLSLLLATISCQAKKNITDAAPSNENNTNSSANIAVAAAESSLNSEISDVAGRAPYYIIFNENGELLKALRNPGLNSGGGASMEVISLLLNESCKTIIAGKFGYKMQTQLENNNIKYYERTGIVKEIVQSFNK